MEFIVYEQKGNYGVITISREKALNALNSTVLEELDKTLAQTVGVRPAGRFPSTRYDRHCRFIWLLNFRRSIYG